MRILISFLICLSASMIVYFAIPSLVAALKRFQQHRAEAMADKIDGIFLQSKEKKKAISFVLLPLGLGFAAFLFVPGGLKLIAVVIAFLFGLMIPSMQAKFAASQRKSKFYGQLVDALMMMNSALKGGLSLIQAMEVVADEMPEPISQEFSVLIGENKMGVSLEASFDRMYARMGNPALQQFISAVLLARETGGNLPIIFNRIIGTIRENRKIQQNIETLTIQGKLQGVVMSGLPVLFAGFIYSSNPHYFDSMLESELGKNLLILAVFLEIIGGFLILKISKIKDF